MDETIVREIVRFPIYLLISFGVTLILGWPLGKVLDGLNPLKGSGKPEGMTDDQWNYFEHQIPGGDVIGRFERTFFFATILANIPVVVAGWLAFKVASKWQVWANVYQVPESLKKIDPVDYFIFRTHLGARIYQRFLVGMLGNILAAIIGVAVFRALVELRPCFCP